MTTCMLACQSLPACGHRHRPATTRPRQLHLTPAHLPAVRLQANPLPMATTTDLVDALYDRVPVLSDWKELIGALLEDARSERHSDMDHAHLAALLAAALQRATVHGDARKKQVGWLLRDGSWQRAQRAAATATAA